MKQNPKAIKALKRVMTEEQLIKFINNVRATHGLSDKEIDLELSRETVLTLIAYPHNSFSWMKSDEREIYWKSIFEKLTQKEYNLTLFI